MSADTFQAISKRLGELEADLARYKQDLADLEKKIAAASLKRKREALKAAPGATSNMLEDEKNRATKELPPASPPPAKRAKRTTSRIDDKTREAVVKQVHNDFMTWEEVAAAHNISQASVARIMAEHRSNKKTERKRRGRKQKLSEEDLMQVLEWIEEGENGNDAWLSSKAIVARLKATRGKEVSASTLEACLEELGIAAREALPIPKERWNTPEVLEKRKLFTYQLMVVCGQRAKVYVGVCPFHLKLHQKKKAKVRSEDEASDVLQEQQQQQEQEPQKQEHAQQQEKEGTTQLTLTPLPKRRTLSLIAALSDDGLCHSQFVPFVAKHKRHDANSDTHKEQQRRRGVTASDLELFLEELAKRVPRESVVVIDERYADWLGGSFVTRLHETYHISVLLLPSCSPFLNPMEYCFAKLKEGVGGSSYKSVEELRAKIEEALGRLTRSDVAEFTKQRMIPCLGQSVLGKPFTQGRPLAPVLDEQAAGTGAGMWSFFCDSNHPLQQQLATQK
ncbi:Ceramide glucosyltransferase [Balamuthia mandrillaris]